MELQYFGGNCIKITTKKASIVVDDNLASLGLKSVTKPGDIALFTSEHGLPNDKVKLVIDLPGEYEVSNTSITGVSARAHIDTEGQKSAVMYKIIADDIRLAVVGHIDPKLSETQLEALGTIDILVIPVGGNGFTLDPAGALQVIKEIEPKIIVPTNYADNQLKYPVPATDLETAAKGLSMEIKETTDKLKLKGSDILTDQAQLIVLERQ
jgi:L-ascorbate metabolism protein UlaG (beta-lactamase superfamily)